MREETVRFVNHVVWDGDGKLATMLSAPFSFIDARLAALYGVPAPGGQGFQQVSLNPAERAGIVTQASLLAGFSPAVETSPFKRGAWVRTRMLCQELPVPPNEVPPLPEPKDGVSNRQRARGAHQGSVLRRLPQADRRPRAAASSSTMSSVGCARWTAGCRWTPAAR